MQRGRKRGTDWEGQQRERVRTERVECGRASTGHSGTGASGTGAAAPEHADDIEPWRTDKHYVLSILFVFSLNIGVGCVG